MPVPHLQVRGFARASQYKKSPPSSGSPSFNNQQKEKDRWQER
jgi:hypothetical protein